MTVLWMNNTTVGAEESPWADCAGVGAMGAEDSWVPAVRADGQGGSSSEPLSAKWGKPNYVQKGNKLELHIKRSRFLIIIPK